LIPILTYHSWHVSGNSYDTNDQLALATDLEVIRRKGLRVCSLHAVIDAIEKGSFHEVDGAVAITFDDGSNFDFRAMNHPTWGSQPSMYSALAGHARRGFSVEATSFAIVSPQARDELDRGRGWWSDDWWAEADASGLLRVESHSWDHNHADLVGTVTGRRPGTFDLATFAQADSEIRAANAYLCERRGRPGPVMFAYPYGDHNAAVDKAVEEAGFAVAVTIQSESYLPFAVGRLHITNADTVDVLASKLALPPVVHSLGPG